MTMLITWQYRAVGDVDRTTMLIKWPCWSHDNVNQMTMSIKQWCQSNDERGNLPTHALMLICRLERKCCKSFTRSFMRSPLIGGLLCRTRHLVIWCKTLRILHKIFGHLMTLITDTLSKFEFCSPALAASSCCRSSCCTHSTVSFGSSEWIWCWGGNLCNFSINNTVLVEYVQDLHMSQSMAAGSLDVWVKARNYSECFLFEG